MRVGLHLYRFATHVLSPFAGMILNRRVVRGKESQRRLNERKAKSLAARPDGPLIWLHAASVGESLLQIALAKALIAQGRSVNFLFTCQTLTGADRINDSLDNDPAFKSCWHLQQMAPLDLPGSAKRFVDHWRPDLAIFAEGDIWPNLLRELTRKKIPSALINARMTEKSLTGWSQWKETAAHVFSSLDVILASDKQTAVGIGFFVKRAVPCPGNLKSALPPPPVSKTELDMIQQQLSDRKIFVAASTHEGEEALILDAIMQMDPRPFTIIAPRHPERGDQIEGLLQCSGLTITRRSREDDIDPKADILLADTMGEMGLWYRLADTVYLGGGHSPGVGGHNPLEPLRLGIPVMSGPSLFNFADMSNDLIARKGLTIVNSVDDIVAAFPSPPPPDALLQSIDASALEPMNATLAALKPYLDAMQARQ